MLHKIQHIILLIRATDAEGQTADRAFSITITVGANNFRTV